MESQRLRSPSPDSGVQAPLEHLNSIPITTLSSNDLLSRAEIEAARSFDDSPEDDQMA